ncbi:hypothetical protein [Aequorivita sp. CIP111184]|uniref:hypothetical protein n=1 Tax=Aequorivita sp. CIP111184 TaxID=2211356 RepID=UPI000DBC4254|nr:hypothetical protein [Aequorivita sp. CIP111184]SRX55313.1 hypothetical protein AEQU1_02335 [Aequorivita sp. CIP111184]
MKTKGFILLFFAIFLLNSCSVDKCDVDCNSGPLELDFELLNKATGENLFTNGTFDPNDIDVLDLDNNNSSVQFTFNSENDINIINLGPFGWETNIANYFLKVGDRDIFTLHVDAEEKTEDCCSFVQVNKLEITNASFELNPETGVYEVLVEL